MKKEAKIALSIILAVVLILGIIGGVVLLSNSGSKNNNNNGGDNNGGGNNNTETDQPIDNTITSRLDAPKNLRISDSWILSFDAVDKAASYAIFINGDARITTTQNTGIDVSGYTRELGKYVFVVRANHKMSSFNSNPSNSVEKNRTKKLTTPTASFSGNILMWSSVDDARSYELKVTLSNSSTESYYATSNSHDFSEFLERYPNETRFQVQVKATNKYLGQSGSEFILDSEYSQPEVYQRIQTISNPEITASFDLLPAYILKENSPDRLDISWQVDKKVAKYMLFCNEVVIYEIENASFATLSVLTVNLKTVADFDALTLGEKTLYLRADPLTTGGVAAGSKLSNEVTYQVKTQLQTPTATSMTKGQTLTLNWVEVDNATSYKLKLYGNDATLDEGDELILVKGSNEINVNSATNQYTINNISDLSKLYKNMKFTVQACKTGAGSEYYIDSLVSAKSPTLQAVAVLPTVTGIDVNVDNTTGSVTISWEPVTALGASGYLIKLYQANPSGTGYVKGSYVNNDVTIENVATSSCVISNYMTDLDAGYYTFTITTQSDDPFYTSSAPSIVESNHFFKFKKRLSAPTNINCVKASQEDNHGTITLSWSAVTHAEAYNIYIDNNYVGTVSQAGNNTTMSETTLVTNYMSTINTPNQYSIEIQAIITSEESEYLNSPRALYTFENRFKKDKVDTSTITTTQQVNSNTVTVNWDNASNADNGYTLTIQTANITMDLTTNSCTLNRNQLILGENTFTITTKGSGYYDDSTSVSHTFDYYYYLDNSIYTGISFALVEVEENSETVQKIRATIKSVDEEITDYYAVFKKQDDTVLGGIHGTTTAGTDCVIDIPFEYAPKFQTTKVIVYAGAKLVEDGVVTEKQHNFIVPAQAYINRNVSVPYIYSLTNDFVIVTPVVQVTNTGSLASPTYQLSVNLGTDANVLTFISEIHWNIKKKNVDSAICSGVITQSQIAGLSKTGNDYIYTQNLGEFLSSNPEIGDYEVFLSLYSTNNNVSAEVSSEFMVQGKLRLNSSSFVADTDLNKTLRWDGLTTAGEYDIKVYYSSTDVTNEVTIEAETEYVGGAPKVVLNVEKIFEAKKSGTYKFVVIAKPTDTTHYIDSDPIEYEWTLNAMIDAPNAQVTKDTLNTVQVSIPYQKYVDTYKVTVSYTGIANPIVYTSSGWYDKYRANPKIITVGESITITLEDINYAGDYTITVQAIPANTDLYNSPEKVINYRHTLPFSKVPEFTFEQVDEDATTTVTLSWGNVSMRTLANDTVTPAVFRVSLDTSHSWDFNAADLTYSSGHYSKVFVSNIDSTDFSALQAGSIITIVALGVGNYFTDSEGSSIEYSLKPRFDSISVTVGTSNLQYGTITNIDNPSQVQLNLCDTTGLETNTVQFDMEITKVGENTSTAVYSNRDWSNGVFTLNTNNYFTSRGVYKIKVRASANAVKAASLWSNNYVYIFYGVQLGSVQNIVMNSDGTNFNISFDALDEKLKLDTETTLTITYTGTIAIQDEATTINNINLTPANTSLSLDSYPALQSAISNSKQITLTIVASTTNSSYTVGSTPVSFNFAPNSTTLATYQQGVAPAPSDITFEYDSINHKLNISWNGTANGYKLSILRRDSSNFTEYYNGSSWQTNQPTDLGTNNKYYSANVDGLGLYTVNIRGVNSGATDSAPVSATFSNTIVSTITSFDIDYNKNTQIFTASWTFDNEYLNNASALTTPKYKLYLNNVLITPSAVALTSSNNVPLPYSVAEVREFIKANGRIANYQLVFTDSYWNNATLHKAYDFGGLDDTESGTAMWPLVVLLRDQDQTVSEINDFAFTYDLANNDFSWNQFWNRTTNAFGLTYSVSLKKYSGGTYIDCGGRDVQTTQTNLTQLSSTESFNTTEKKTHYKIVFKIKEDTTNKIYCMSEKTFEFYPYGKADPVSNMQVTTPANDNGNRVYSTTIYWSYADVTHYNMNEIFVIDVLDESGNVLVNIPSSMIAEDGVDVDKTRYRVVLTGLPGDPTYNLPGGTDYQIRVYVKAYNFEGEDQLKGIRTQSDPVSRSYTKQVGLSKLTDQEMASLYLIVPDVFITGVANSGDPTLNAYNTTFYNEYVQANGINKKYLIINDDQLSLAQYYVVYLNGVELGKILNKKVINIDLNSADDGAAAWAEFANANADNMIELRGYRWGEINEISIMPWGDSNYKYLDNGNTYSLDATFAKEGLTNSKSEHLYTKYSMSDVVLNQTYYNNDTRLLDTIDVYTKFKTSERSKGAYNITIYYEDYYNNNTVTTIPSYDVELDTDEFDINEILTVSIFDKIKLLGPCKFWIEIYRHSDMGRYAQGEPFYLRSDTHTTSTIDYTIALQGWTLDSTDTSKVSIITEVTAHNEIGDTENGWIYWTLPTPQYSMQVEYTFEVYDLIDHITRNCLSYTTTLNIVVGETVDVPITYSIVNGTENDYLKLVTINSVQYMAGNMLQFIQDRLSDNLMAHNYYYLAGDYIYTISAVCLDKNGNKLTYFDNRVKAPNDFALSEDTHLFIYRDVYFPNKPVTPTLVVSSQDANYTTEVVWNYVPLAWDKTTHNTLDDIDADTPAFGIVIYNYNPSTDTWTMVYHTKDHMDEAIGSARSFDITNYLVGGRARNKVYVYRIVPGYTNSLYINIENEDAYWVEADVSALPEKEPLPTIDANWSNDDKLNTSISEDISSIRRNDYETYGYKTYFDIDIIKVSYYTAVDPSYDYDDIIANGIAYKFLNFATIEYVPLVADYTSVIYTILDNITAEHADRNEWINADDRVIIEGQYFIKITLKTLDTATLTNTFAYYDTQVVKIRHSIKPLWRLYADSVDLSGENLTTVNQNGVVHSATTTAKDDWGAADQKETLLKFKINVNKDGTDNKHIPEQITVSMPDLNNTTVPHSITFNLPAYNSILWDAWDNDILIEHFYEDGSTVPKEGFVWVTLDLHELFDTLTVGGVYAITWYIETSDYGNESSKLCTAKQVGQDYIAIDKSVCHYVILPTPVLDSRLGYFFEGNDMNYAITWGLKPLINDFKGDGIARENIYNITERKVTQGNTFGNDYQVTIIAFKSGTTLPEGEGTDRYLQSGTINATTMATNKDTMIKSLLVNEATNITTPRLCYVNPSSTDTNRLNLIPNTTYKFFMYISASGMDNSEFYLKSFTSTGVEYTYMTPSYQINPSKNNLEYADFKTNGVSFANQNSSPSALEFIVYNTQYRNNGAIVSTNDNWINNPNYAGAIISHYIIKPGDVTANSILAAYTTNGVQVADNVGAYTINPSTYSTTFSFGTAAYSTSLVSLLLPEPYASRPITYYCMVKAWSDEDIVNRNVPNGGQTIYNLNWLCLDAECDEDTVTCVGNKLDGYQTTNSVFPLDSYNELNYFTLQNKITLATPGIKSVIVNNGASSYTYTFNNSSNVSTSTPVTLDATNSNFLENGFVKIYVDDFDYHELFDTQQDLEHCSWKLTCTFSYKNMNDQGGLDNNYINIEGAEFDLNTDANGYFILIDKTTDAGQSLLPAIHRVSPNDFKVKVKLSATKNANMSFKSITNTNIPMDYGITAGNDSADYSLTIKAKFSTPIASLLYYNEINNELQTQEGLQNQSGTTIPTNLMADGKYQDVAAKVFLNASSTYVYSNERDRRKYEKDKLSHNNYTYQIIAKDSTKSSYNLNINTTNLLSSNNGLFRYSGAINPSYLNSVVQDYFTKVGREGGYVTLYIQVLASSGDAYWSNSDIATFSFYYYERLASTITELALGNVASGTNGFETRNANYIATAYRDKNPGEYYYYQSNIPVTYTTVENSAGYRIILSRPDYDSYSVTSYGLADFNDGQFNLSQILKVDKTGYNQWALSESAQDMWKINMYALPSSGSFYSRAMDSNDGVYYAPQLMLVQDVSSLTIAMTNEARNQVYSDLISYTTSVEGAITGTVTSSLRNDTTVQSTFTGTPYNRAAIGKDIQITAYSANNSQLYTSTTEITSGNNYVYKARFNAFLNAMKDAKIPGQTVTLKWKFLGKTYNAEASNGAKSIVFASVTGTYTFDYLTFLENVPFSVSQSGTKLVTEATLPTYLGADVTFMLNQAQVNNTAQLNSKSQGSTKTVSGDNTVYKSEWTFDKNHADAYSTDAFGETTANKLANNTYTLNGTAYSYVYDWTNSKGYIQVGQNCFGLTISGSNGSVDRYTVINPNVVYSAQRKFIVPENLCPTVGDVSYSTTTIGGATTSAYYDEDPCSNCRGSGTETYVWYSNNYGTKSCGTCGGSGTKTTSTSCGSCSGSGKVTCTLCNGKGSRSVSCPTTQTCSLCGGTGSRTVTCSTCRGSGKVWRDSATSGSYRTCSSCGGSGSKTESCSKTQTCDLCGGSGTRTIDCNRKQTCGSCGGKGNIESSVKCTTCRGTGSVTDYTTVVSRTRHSSTRTCSRCSGTGKYGYHAATKAPSWVCISSFNPVFSNYNTATIKYSGYRQNGTSGSSDNTISEMTVSYSGPIIPSKNINYMTYTLTAVCKYRSYYGVYFANQGISTKTNTIDLRSSYNAGY